MQKCRSTSKDKWIFTEGSAVCIRATIKDLTSDIVEKLLKSGVENCVLEKVTQLKRFFLLWLPVVAFSFSKSIKVAKHDL